MSDVTKTVRDISELKQVAQVACNLFMSECKKAGIDIFITETYRSQARQNYLYEQGRTRPGDEITWTRSSRHTSRLAWDIAVKVPKGQDPYKDTKTFVRAGAVAKKLGITWGGDWKKPDMPHFEVKSTWKAPKGYAVTNTKVEESVRMFTPTSSTINNEFIKILEKALEDKIITDKNWVTKAKAGQLPLDDAVALVALINSRK